MGISYLMDGMVWNFFFFFFLKKKKKKKKKDREL